MVGLNNTKIMKILKNILLINKKMLQSCLITAKKKHFIIRYLPLILLVSEGNGPTNIVFSNL